MKKISPKAKVIIFVLLIIVVWVSVSAGKTYFRNNRITNELTAIAESHGLKDVKIHIGSKMSNGVFYEVTVDSSNLESLSYNQMYALADSMRADDAFVSNYTSNGNSYEIFPFTKSIYKNNREIHSDYWHSDSYYDVAKNNSNKTYYTPSTTNNFTPHKPSYKDDNDDPYNAKDYSNEEDFYYDHYDDFFDYEDAEEYYNEHND